MSIAPLLSFDEETPRGSGEIGATQQIARVLESAGVDAPASLYDEALVYAQEGRLAPAAERLRMLLTLDANDGEAALLLAKVLAARELWQEALSWLDASHDNGALTPPGLRDLIEDGLRRQVNDAEDYRNRVTARERGEVRNLRNESKKLRSVNAALEVEIDELQRRVRMWSGTTAIVAGASSALLLAALIFSGGAAETAPAVAEEALPELPAASASIVAPAVPMSSGAATTSVPVESMPVSAPAVVAATVEAPVAAPPAVVPAAAQAVAPAAKQGAVLATHTVRKGDTLGSLAKKYYGNQGLWPQIKDANRGVLHGGESLSVGMKLAIPAK